ncbi:MAG: hypothetical protein ACSLFF_04660 [Solirubrobacterales bacterium]
MASLFSRVTRYTPSDRHDPRENRLTEITAAVLERVPGLEFQFARALLENELPWWIDSDARARVATQVYVSNETGHGFVDLVLSFYSSADEHLLEFDLLVEVKHGSPESGAQLDFYSDAMSRRALKPSSLVVLAGRDFGDRAELSDGTAVRVVQWHRLAEALRKFDRSNRTAENAWFLREYLSYLNEEGLMSAKPIDVEALMFAALYPQSNESIEELHRVAIGRATEWGPLAQNLGGYAATSYGPGKWHLFSPGGSGTSPWGEDVWFEFNFRADTGLNPDRTSLAFFSGATFGRKAAIPSDEWFIQMAAEGIERFEDDGLLRAMSVKYPADLLGFESIDTQGLAVGDWVLATFETLHANPPG